MAFLLIGDELVDALVAPRDTDVVTIEQNGDQAVKADKVGQFRWSALRFDRAMGSSLMGKFYHCLARVHRFLTGVSKPANQSSKKSSDGE